MPRRHHILVSLAAAVTTAVLAAGCSEDVRATPRITFDSSIAPGTHSVQECPESGTWFTIGAFGNPALGRVDPANPESPLKEPVRPVEDGAQDEVQGGTVRISCSVVPAGDAFDVAATAELTGTRNSGFFQVIGKFKKGQTNPDINIVISKAGSSYKQANCTATFNATVGQGVDAGRVWAEVECPNIENASQQRICAGRAQFRFENCAQ